jgi:hypothetical protein
MIPNEPATPEVKEKIEELGRKIRPAMPRTRRFNGYIEISREMYEVLLQSQPASQFTNDFLTKMGFENFVLFAGFGVGFWPPMVPVDELQGMDFRLIEVDKCFFSA